jgi:hypothetical protein
MYANTEIDYVFDECYVLMHIQLATWSALLPSCLLPDIRMCEL